MVWLKPGSELLKNREFWVFIVVKPGRPSREDLGVGSPTLLRIACYLPTPFATEGLPLFGGAEAEMAAAECWK